MSDCTLKENAVLPFQRPEYLQRIANVKRRMDAAGTDVLLISDPCNMNYLTGYDATSYYVHQMVALALEAEEPLWIGRPDGCRLRPLHDVPRGRQPARLPGELHRRSRPARNGVRGAAAAGAGLGSRADRDRDGRPF